MLEIAINQTLGDLRLNINTRLPANGITAIFGLSGAGKTSLINVIAGLTQPKNGRIALNGRLLMDTQRKLCLAPEKRRIGYVFQDARLFPHYSVGGNLRYGMAADMAAQFDSIVDLLGISHLLKRYPSTLSGGEKQRVAIGRALLSGPQILLMDEPLAALDLPRKRELLPYLERLAADVNIPILYVTHSLAEIVRLAEHVLVLDNGQVLASGELEQVWASDILRPWLEQQDRGSIVNVRLTKHHPNYSMSALALGEQLIWVNKIEAKLGTNLTIQINAVDISLVLAPLAKSSIRNLLAATIISCTESDDQVEVKLEVSGHTLWARVTPWARDELGLCAGLVVFAQIKSVSISRGIAAL